MRHLAASPDLEEVASADDGGLVSLLRLSDGRLVERAARGAEDGWVRELAWDGRALHMLDRSGVARRWPLDEAPPTRWDLLGTWTNLRVCRETGEVVPVVPFPSDPTSVWAPPGACGPVGSGAPTDLGGAGRPLVGRAPSPERGWVVGGAGLVSSLLGWVAGG